MAGVTLQLFFHGLIALVPNKDLASKPDAVTAYLVQSMSHDATLSFEMTDTSVCPQETLGETECAPEETTNPWCVCKLGGGVKIEFQSKMASTGRPLKDKPVGNFPKPSDADDFSWLVRMASIHGVPKVRIRSDLADKISAEMSFGILKEMSCHLDQKARPYSCEQKPGSGCEFDIFYFEFTDGAATSAHQQALAEYAMFETIFPLGSVGLVLTEGAKKVSLNLGCGPDVCPDILVANLPSGEPSDPDVGEHFIAYYTLADPGANLKELIPHRLAIGQSIDRRQLFTCPDDPLRRRESGIPQREQERARTSRKYASNPLFEEFDSDVRRTAAETRIICPMAMFDP
ncbi:MAG: hypothetical protein ACXW39_10930 [Nitrospira sp.]